MILDRILLNHISKMKKSVLLLGPRQTGKSTLMRELKPDCILDLSNEEVFTKYLSDPGLLAKTTHKYRKILIDEVQRIPSLLNTIQSIVDADKAKQFLLTGSSARKLRRGQANLLPGRLVTYELGPLSLAEIPKPYDVEILLSKGLLPGIYLETDDDVWKKLLRSYGATYLKEEIQAEALTRNLEGFSRFFRVVSSRCGDFLDISKFSSQAEIDRTSAKRYFEILQDTLVVTSLEAFTKSERVRLVQHPRYYFFDVGVLNGVLSNFEPSADRIGRLFEHLCLQLICSGYKSTDRDFRVSVYRTAAGAEVDFIIETGKSTIACEVKATRKIGSDDFSGLESFKSFFGKKCEKFILYLGKDSYDDRGTQIRPWNNGIEEILAL